MLYTAFILGLASSLHCVGMCGPILLMISGKNKQSTYLLLYHTARILTYGMLGLIAGIIGKNINLLGFQQQLSLIAGILILLIYFLAKWKSLATKFNFYPAIHKVVSKYMYKRKLPTYFLGGILNGLLPCGMVYFAMAASIAFVEISASALYMIFFGLGTLPLLALVHQIKPFLQRINSYISLRKIVNINVVILALLFILRGLSLGIPYISPSFEISENKDQQEIPYCHPIEE